MNLDQQSQLQSMWKMLVRDDAALARQLGVVVDPLTLLKRFVQVLAQFRWVSTDFYMPLPLAMGVPESPADARSTDNDEVVGLAAYP